VLAGVVVGALSAAIAPTVQFVRERLNREDDVKQYKRIVYRNFLDHGFWYRTLPNGDEKTERHKKYTADWYRIQLITEDQAVRDAVNGLGNPANLDDKTEKRLIAVFVAEIGEGGLGD
jgi:hypothetical protein